MAPAAESFSHLLTRARTFLADLTELEDDLTIVITHGQFMQAAKLMIAAPRNRDLTAMSLFIDRQLRRPFANCERMELAHRGDTIRVVEVTPCLGIGSVAEFAGQPKIFAAQISSACRCEDGGIALPEFDGARNRAYNRRP